MMAAARTLTLLRQRAASVMSSAVFKTAFLFVAFLATARIGVFLFAATNTGPALVWPPAGIAIAFLFLWGYSYWPAVALAALANSYMTGTDFPLAAGSMIGQTAQAVAGAYFLRRLGYDKRAARLQDMLALFAVAFFVTTICGTPGLILRFLVYHLEPQFILDRWVTLWLGSMISVILITPIITSWAEPIRKINKKRFAEGAIAFLILIAIELLMFWGTSDSFAGISYIYIMMLPLFWLSLRMGPKFIVAAVFITSAIFVSGIFYGRVEVPASELGRSLMQVEILVIVISVIFYILSAISEERKKAVEDLHAHIRQLEGALETIKHHALHDVLTGLPNRKALEERFALVKSMATRHNQKIAMLFLDLDQFKNINDTLGHNVGDLVLKQVADRLKEAVREVDIVARLGGDEFIIILTEVSSARDIELVAMKLLQQFIDRPIEVMDNTIQTTTSIGIATFPDSGEDLNALLRSSDIALYRAKEQGRNRFQFYDLDMKNRLHAKLSLEQDLRRAIDRQQLKLFYHPIWDIKTNQIKSAEALIRWHHPQLGMLSPDRFIPLAEDTGLIMSIGDWVINRACKQARQWKDKGLRIPVSINLSSKQFYSSSLTDTIGQALRRYALHPKELELEITESVAMQATSRSDSQLKDLVKMGVCITMDDFGTGYSSLSYLRSLHINKLKIDKSFVKDMVTNQYDATIIRTIISMGHTLGLKVCAEGIETAEQRDMLSMMGCDTGQGYFMCEPLEGVEFMHQFKKVETAA